MNKKRDEINELKKEKLRNDVAFWIIVIVFIIVLGYLFITGRAFK